MTIKKLRFEWMNIFCRRIIDLLPAWCWQELPDKDTDTLRDEWLDIDPFDAIGHGLDEADAVRITRGEK